MRAPWEGRKTKSREEMEEERKSWKRDGKSAGNPTPADRQTSTKFKHKAVHHSINSLIMSGLCCAMCHKPLSSICICICLLGSWVGISPHVVAALLFLHPNSLIITYGGYTPHTGLTQTTYRDPVTYNSQQRGYTLKLTY